MSLINAFRAFWGVFSGSIDADALLKAPVVEAVEEKKDDVEESGAGKTVVMEEKGDRFEEGSIFSLVLLQREGRLIDFLQEDIEGFADEQIGAAVRQIHAGCKKVLTENFEIKPVLNSNEGENVSVNDGFDPSEIKLTGNPPENGPYNGTLQHKGWIVKNVKFPERSGKVNTKVVYPAEVSF